MRQKPIDFIHIGMGKCASTYLQNVFHKDPDFNLFDIQNILGLTLEKSRQGAEPEDSPNVNISFDPSLLHGIENIMCPPLRDLVLLMSQRTIKAFCIYINYRHIFLEAVNCHQKYS